MSAIDPTLFSMFVVTTVALIVSPGPVVSLLIAETLRYGPRHGLSVMVGALVAGIIYVSIYLLGAASFMMNLSDATFDLIRYIGVAYLGFMAVNMIRSEGISIRKEMNSEDVIADKTYLKAGIHGFIVTASSPKTVIFFAAFFPQFIHADLPMMPQLIIMSITLLTIGMMSDLMWIYIAYKIRGWFFKKNYESKIGKISGAVLLLGAVVLLFIN